MRASPSQAIHLQLINLPDDRTRLGTQEHNLLASMPFPVPIIQSPWCGTSRTCVLLLSGSYCQLSLFEHHVRVHGIVLNSKPRIVCGRIQRVMGLHVSMLRV